MVPLDSEIGKARALVIDGNAASRSVLTSMLREFGVADITQARKAQEARRLLETQRFDIVLCEYHFDDEPVSGQDIMDDLRLAQLLPLATVVVMISSEAGYAKVAEAAEAALDAYLVKPHTQEALRQRLVQARQRKVQLGDIITLVEKQAYIEAAEICEVRFKTRGPAWVQAARIGAELWLRLGKPHAAQQMFDAILQAGAVPWARLGVARAQYDAGGHVQARRTLESLLNEQPAYADAYDVMGRVLLDQGLPEQALDAMRQATALTPGSVSRIVKHGLLAYYYGEPKEAADALAKAARLGLNSRIYDLQGLVLLAAVQFDLADRRGLAGSHSSMVAARAPVPQSARLRRFEVVIGALKALIERRVPEAVRDAQALIGEIAEPNFEFEAACNLLSLLARLQRSELQLQDLDHDVDVLARRFAVSRTTCELLVRAARAQQPFEAVIRAAYAKITAGAEDAVSRTVNGQPGEAVRLLLAQAEQTLNAKLIDLALHTLERHGAAIERAPDLLTRVQALHQQYRGYGTQVHLSRANEPRAMAAAAKS
ncbi:response regulator [Rhizobacter sp. LjRoot28]|uniref:response regulator n=1 Tax=Rhizobacter sp. LjRoot28 TaxID=3342309 RepID=UPI003ECF0CA0